MHLLILNGPNLNLLGTREPETYGTATLADVLSVASAKARSLGHTSEAFQSNHEGELIDRLHSSRGTVDGIVFNPGAFSHTSYALHDAILATSIPTVEVHISNVKEREPWRADSRVSAACVYTIYGRGIDGYTHAISHLHHLDNSPPLPVSYGSEERQTGDLRLPAGPGPHPLAIFLHGGFWRHQWTSDTIEPLAADLTNRGFASWNLEYSRSGLGPCHASADVSLAIASVPLLAEKHPIDPLRTIIIGHSAGGHLALEGAAGGSVSQVVSLAGVSNLIRAEREGLGQGASAPFLGNAAAADHCPTELLPLGSPVLLVHGTVDENVPVSYSDDFKKDATARGDTVEYLRLDGVDHFQLVDPNHSSWLKVAGLLEETFLSD